MELPRDLQRVIVSDPDLLGGTPCFAGTRVPLATFLDYVEEGFSLDRFLEGYSGVQRVQAEAVLSWQADQSRRLVGLV